MALVLAMRVTALEEVCSLVRDMDVFPIRETDLITVCSNLPSCPIRLFKPTCTLLPYPCPAPHHLSVASRYSRRSSYARDIAIHGMFIVTGTH